MGNVVVSRWSHGGVPYITSSSPSLASEHSRTCLSWGIKSLSVSQPEFVCSWEFTSEATTNSKDKSNSSVSIEGFTTELYKLFVTKELFLPSHWKACY